MEKQKWKKPVLIIIKRDRPEENVLLACDDDFVHCPPETTSPTS